MVTKKKKAAKAQARAERENKERRRIEEEQRKAQGIEEPEAAAQEEAQDEEIVPEVPPKEKHYIWLAIISVPVAICCVAGSQPFVALVMAAVALGVYRYNQIMYEDQEASRVPFWCGVACIALAIAGWIFMALPAVLNTATSFS